MRVTLRFLSGELKGEQREVEIPPGRTLTIGRGSHCDVVLGERDRSASSTHAKLWLDDRGGLYLTDVGSQYGTFVDGKPATKARLKIGSKVQFGFKGPIVLLTEPSAAAAAEPQPRPRPRPVKKPRPVAMTTVRAVPDELLAEFDGIETKEAPAEAQRPSKFSSKTPAPKPHSEITPPSPATTEPSPLQPGYKPCPFCAEPIREGAIKCRFCHEFLDPSQAPGGPGFQPVPASTSPTPPRTQAPSPSPDQSVTPLPPPVPDEEEALAPVVPPPDEPVAIPATKDGPLTPPVPATDEDADRATADESIPNSEPGRDVDLGLEDVGERTQSELNRPRTELIQAFDDGDEDEESDTVSAPVDEKRPEGGDADEPRRWKTQTFAVPFDDEEDDENGPGAQAG